MDAKRLLSFVNVLVLQNAFFKQDIHHVVIFTVPIVARITRFLADVDIKYG